MFNTKSLQYYSALIKNSDFLQTEFMFLLKTMTDNKTGPKTKKELLFFITLFINIFLKKKTILKNKQFSRRARKFFKFFFLKYAYKQKNTQFLFLKKKIKFPTLTYLTFFLTLNLQFKDVMFLRHSGSQKNTRLRFYSLKRNKIANKRSYHHVFAYLAFIIRFCTKRKNSRARRKNNKIRPQPPKDHIRARRYFRRKNAYFKLRRIDNHFQQFKRKRVRNIPAVIYNFLKEKRTNWYSHFRLRRSRKVIPIYNKKLKIEIQNLQKKIFTLQIKKKIIY